MIIMIVIVIFLVFILALVITDGFKTEEDRYNDWIRKRDYERNRRNKF